jgi:hypothetical protein
MRRGLPMRLGALLLWAYIALTLPLHGLAAPDLPAQMLQRDGRFEEAAASWQMVAGREGGSPLTYAAALALVRQLICLRAAGRDGAADALIPRLAAVDTSSVISGDQLLPYALLILSKIESIRQRPDLAEPLLGRGFNVSLIGLGEDHELSRQFIWEALAMSIVADRQKEVSTEPWTDSPADDDPKERRLAIQQLACHEAAPGDPYEAPKQP